jgi:hypothetical protein
MNRTAWIIFASLHAVAFVLVAGSLTLKFVGSALLLPGFLVWFYLGEFVPAAVSVPVAVLLIIMVNALTWRTLAAARVKIQHSHLRHKPSH